jgi:2-desacetyl-2-hydroxyethyl bacteriochlorophyllide A dehydrogenase
VSRAVRIDAPGTLRVVPLDIADPGPGDALIRVAWAGICGSDVEVFQGTRPESYVRYPVVPGHEWSGTVAAVGHGVDRSLIGRPVVGEGFRSCQVCSACRRGEPNICQAAYDETGFTCDGAWADYFVMPARLLHLLPGAADLRAAAGLEPSACSAEACLKAAVQQAERVAVVGGGTLGLLAAQLVSARSPAELVVVHPSMARADVASACGATKLVTPNAVADLADRFDVVIEAAGGSGTAAAAAVLARRGGRVVLTGIPQSDDAIGTRQLVTKQLSVQTVFGAPPRAWVHAIRAFEAGLLDPSVLVTHEFALEDAADALNALVGRHADVGKILLRP